MSENPSQSTEAPQPENEATPVSDMEKAPEVLEEAAPEKPSEPALEPQKGLAEEIRVRFGEDVYRCYQCLKCSAGCPMTFAMDLPPSQIMRFIQLGQEDILLSSKTIWVCLSCNTCSIRCPNDIDIALVIDSLRERALAKGVKPAFANSALFHKSFLKNIKKRGRTYEGELLGPFLLKTGQLTSYAGLGMRMFFKGRLSFIPERVKDKKAFREIFRKVEKRGGKK